MSTVPQADGGLVERVEEPRAVARLLRLVVDELARLSDALPVILRETRPAARCRVVERELAAARARIVAACGFGPGGFHHGPEAPRAWPRPRRAEGADR